MAKPAPSGAGEKPSVAAVAARQFGACFGIFARLRAIGQDDRFEVLY